MKKLYYVIQIIFLVFIFLNCFCTFSFGAYPKLVNTITSAFKTIESWLLRISTPAAAVAVGSGVFMKKLALVMRKELEQEKELFVVVYFPMHSSFVLI